MSIVHDRVKETTTTVGTGDLTLLGAVVQFVAFSSRYAVSPSAIFPYVAVGQSGTEWETGFGYLSGASTLVRSVVSYSSNGDALVNFSAGTKDVFVSPTARSFQERDALPFLLMGG